MSNPTVLVSQRNGVCTITLNRPKQGNALLLSMYALISAALKDAASDPNISAVIVTGSGKYFTTGADVGEAAARALEGATIDDLLDNIRKGPVVLTQALIDFPKFAVAAVNGPVVGYPAGLLGLFDMVVVSQSASFQIPFLQLGLIPEAGSSVTLPKIVGSQMMTDLLLTNRLLSAEEMVAAGLASRLLPDEGFGLAVAQLVEKGVAASSSASIVAAKALLRASTRDELTKANAREADAICQRFQSGEPEKRFAKVFMGIGRKKKGDISSKL